MRVDHNALLQKFLTAFAYALGIAAAKWFCAMIPLRGFNLNF